MKKGLVHVFTLILFLCSCSNDVPAPQESGLIAHPEITAFLSNGQSTQLSISASPGVEAFDSIQWYETNRNGDTFKVIEGENSLIYEVPAFDTEQIRYFVCKVSKGKRTETSTVFSVAHTGLPIVSITTDGSEITKETWLDADLVIDGNALAGMIKGRGNSSWRFPKKSYSLKLSNKTELFGMPEHKRWVLIGNTIDGSLLRNYFASYIGNEVFTGNGWNPSFVFVDLVIDGTYWGNYILGEQIKIDKNRVDTGIGNGGFIAEVNFWKDEAFNFYTAKGIPISLKDPDEVSGEIQQYVQQVIQTAEDALFSENFTDAETGYSKYFDVDSVIDWYLVNEITSNSDAAFKSSVYMYYDNKDGKIHMGPNWDFDLSCGQKVSEVTVNVTLLHIKNSKWMKRFFEDPSFETAVKARYSQVRTEIANAVNTMLTEMAQSISVSAQLNNARWSVQGDYADSVETLQSWLNARLAWLDTQWL